MYVTDSLFYLQHLVGGNDKDENRCALAMKYSEMMEMKNKPPKEPETAESIIDRMVKKSQKM